MLLQTLKLLDTKWCLYNREEKKVVWDQKGTAMQVGEKYLRKVCQINFTKHRLTFWNQNETMKQR